MISFQLLKQDMEVDIDGMLVNEKKEKVEHVFGLIGSATMEMFDVIIKDNYIGGILAPGVNLSLSTLSDKASLIPRIKLENR